MESKYYNILKKNISDGQLKEFVSEIASRNPKFTAEEIESFYYPAVMLINSRRINFIQHYEQESKLFNNPVPARPYIISLCGSVASGKSTATALLADIMQLIDRKLRIFKISTDCFLMPTDELTKRNLMSRKGFPVSYDWEAQIRFLKEVHSGKKHFLLPIYSHESYDILTDKFNEINNPDVIFMEGLNLLQPNFSDDRMISSDLIDFSIYLHMEQNNLKKFFTERVLSLSHEGNGYYKNMSSLTDEEILKRASKVWETINLPNLTEHIQPTMCRANMIIELDRNHKPQKIKVRN
jgi:type I pantothenate kinase